jgi:RNA polymerase sigma-70 factor (ECF subfamily)
MADPTAPPYDLLQRAAAGDADAFEALVQPHLALFHHGVYRILGHAQDAQDALQDGLLSIYRSLAKFEGRSAFSSWAYRICINAALMQRRSRMRTQEMNVTDLLSPEPGDEQPTDLDHLKESAIPAEAHDHLERQELREKLIQALDLLPPAQREVFVLRDLEDWDTEDVARRLGVSSMVVRQRLHRARDFLFSRLRPYFVGRPA